MLKGSLVRVGITGGAGFIGSNLAQHLVESGYSVSILDNLETGFLSNLEDVNANLVRADLKNSDEVDEFFQKEEIDYCVHLGALGSVPRSIATPRASFEANAIATLNVLESVKKKVNPRNILIIIICLWEKSKTSKDRKRLAFAHISVRGF